MAATAFALSVSFLLLGAKAALWSPTYIVVKILYLESQNVEEVVLTGIHIADYNYENYNLEKLVSYVLKSTSIPRIRISSLEPPELTQKLLGLYQDNPRLCPHFHMSIQSLDALVLEKMKRSYSPKDVAYCLESIHSCLPQAFVGMDIICGFPGETEERFLNTYERLHNLPWTSIHSFPYSPRQGTYALKLPDQNPRHVIKARSRKLSALGEARLLQKQKEQVGLTHQALVLDKKSKKFPNYKEALTKNFWTLLLPSDSDLSAGKQLQVKVSHLKESHLFAQVAQ